MSDKWKKNPQVWRVEEFAPLSPLPHDPPTESHSICIAVEITLEHQLWAHLIAYLTTLDWRCLDFLFHFKYSEAA